MTGWAVFNKGGVFYDTVRRERRASIRQAVKYVRSDWFVDGNRPTKAERDRAWRYLKSKGCYVAKCEVHEL